MAPAHILRLPVSGSPGAHVLVRVVPSSAKGSSRPLDLELTATDDEQAYVRTLQHGKISQFRDKTSSLSEHDWEQCLTSLLHPGELPLGDLNVTAQLKDEDTLTIKFEKKVSGHAEPAGALTLEANEAATESIDIFHWCGDAVAVRSQLERELADLRRKHAELEAHVAEEAAHFAELGRAKAEFEDDHDAFLRDLLNEKKVKIRTQGRVLSTARVDGDRLAAVGAKATKAGSPEAAPRRRGAAGASRKGKRKAGGAAVPDEETDEDAAADVMDIDSKPESPERDLEEQELSDAGRMTEGSETASEPEPEPEPKPEPKKAGRSSARKKGAKASPPPPARASRRTGNPPSSNLRGKSPAVEPESEDDNVPPPRALPFQKKAARAPVPADDESTASEASEL